VRVYICIDVDPSDIALLLMIARQENIPLDALLKMAIAQYITLKLASPRPATASGGEK
jgi:hypothetical protein